MIHNYFRLSSIYYKSLDKLLDLSIIPLARTNVIEDDHFC